MDLINNLVTISQQNDAERPSLFPFPFSMHFVFVCISVLFFIYRFSVQKRPYQIIMASAILVSMGVWISDNRKLYYAIGAIELFLIISAIVSSFIFKAKPAEEATAKSDDDESDDNDGDDDNNGDDSNSGDDEDEDAEDELTAINAANTVNNILNN